MNFFYCIQISQQIKSTADLELINEVSDFVIENQDKYFADSVDKRFLTVDSTNVTVDWNGTV